MNTLPITCRALHYGDGLFETIALKHGVMLFWQEHYQRLILGCQRLKFPIPNEALLLQEIDAVKKNQTRAIIKIILTRNAQERGYRIPEKNVTHQIVHAYPFIDYPKTHYQKGVRVIFCKTQVSENSALAGIKHLNRLDNVLASSEWTDDAISEGLMSDANQHIIQGTKSNVFYVRNQVLYTPDLNRAGILGIMRAQILDWAQQKKIPIKIAAITHEDLLSADEIFICNSIFGIWPVSDIEGHTFPVGEYTQQLIHYFE
ncbi:MAG: aminodeoxychorismate lyase [Legionellales bacterium]|jgi:4-amino-4-deoxychorismate lyase